MARMHLAVYESLHVRTSVARLNYWNLLLTLSMVSTKRYGRAVTLGVTRASASYVILCVTLVLL